MVGLAYEDLGYGLWGCEEEVIGVEEVAEEDEAGIGDAAHEG